MDPVDGVKIKRDEIFEFTSLEGLWVGGEVLIMSSFS